MIFVGFNLRTISYTVEVSLDQGNETIKIHMDSFPKSQFHMILNKHMNMIPNKRLDLLIMECN